MLSQATARFPHYLFMEECVCPSFRSKHVTSLFGRRGPMISLRASRTLMSPTMKPSFLQSSGASERSSPSRAPSLKGKGLMTLSMDYGHGPSNIPWWTTPPLPEVAFTPRRSFAFNRKSISSWIGWTPSSCRSFGALFISIGSTDRSISLSQ
ncbi:unnamed protein product [Lepeophtheirus salmonis]|uniref:(salmon louse) hypothetical protein n=1 Tax=Lepeophtheirus salmonis TaxID=72036 RepID=A0A7R8H1N2_LEPSM|nr:unnamed protein product [Lepeophtheirus salmonis]CAF2815278.1 unnamed protein product [Lepeophtheirus salmonis]